MDHRVTGFIEGFLTVWITGIAGVAGATWQTPPLMAWIIITGGGILAGVRFINALNSEPPLTKKDG